MRTKEKTAEQALEEFQAGKQRRTDALLAEMRGQKNEFTILHGILCMNMALSDKEHAPEWWRDGTADNFAYRVGQDLFDGIRIARRLDELNA